MTTRWLHYIDQNGLELLSSDRDTVRPLQRFAATPQGVAAFRASIAGLQPRGTHDVLVDLPDEGFQIETAPWTRGRERAALLARRINQRFPDTPYGVALRLGRETWGRRDERIVLAALNRPDAIAPWLDTIAAEALPVRSLRSPPLLLPRLLARLSSHSSAHLSKRPPRGLLIALSPAGIRQIYHTEGCLRFARLSPAPEGRYADWASACVQEANKSYQYLCTQRWFERDVPLRVGVLLDRIDFSPFRDCFATTPSLEFTPIDLAELTSEGRLRFPSDSRPLWARLAIESDHGAPQFAPAAVLRPHLRQRVERRALIGGALGLALCTILAGKLQSDRAAATSATEAHLAAAGLARSRTEALRLALPALPGPPEEILEQTEAYAHRVLATPSPGPALIALSHALDAFPQIALTRLEWKSPRPEEVFRSTVPVTPSADLFETIDLSARMPTHSGPEARVRIRSFAAALVEIGGGTVKLSGAVFDPETDATLRSDAASETESTGAFGLRWTRRARSLP